jgi:DtxR family Mn-dependent transcriptional regulator
MPPVPWRRDRARRRRVEDALKHIYTRQAQERLATPKSLADHLGLPMERSLDCLAEMEADRLVQRTERGVVLTPQGEDRARLVVRAHRLWERYLADEIGEPLTGLHRRAERQEHRLSADDVDALEVYLGFPRQDPHGDAIPPGDEDTSSGARLALSEWPVGVPARIAHIEDEPPTALEQIVGAGLRPGLTVEIVDTDPDGLVLFDGRRQARIARSLAGHIAVVRGERSDDVPLSALDIGQNAVVRRIDDQCRGMARRRLLDMGLTPGASVTCVLRSLFGQPTAYRVRGATIALRTEQADYVWVARAAPEPDDAVPA